MSQRKGREGGAEDRKNELGGGKKLRKDGMEKALMRGWFGGDLGMRGKDRMNKEKQGRRKEEKILREWERRRKGYTKEEGRKWKIWGKTN